METFQWDGWGGEREGIDGSCLQCLNQGVKCRIIRGVVSFQGNLEGHKPSGQWKEGERLLLSAPPPVPSLGAVQGGRSDPSV